jgi:hypothetical protein
MNMKSIPLFLSSMNSTCRAASRLARSGGKTLLLGLLAAFMFSAQSADAANHYVRSGASGSGSDWSNAAPALPASLVRGDTYYVADGSYPAYTFKDPQSGTLTITVKKATAADHGTDSGWQAGYGDGQAIFNSVLRFNTGYYVLDGQKRNESDWFDGASYGFRINHNGQDQNIVIGGGSASSNIAVKYVFVDAIYQNLPSTTVRRYAIDTDTYGGSIATNLVFHRMYVYGSNNVWFLRTTNGAIVEYSASNGVASNSANHGEIVNLYYSGNNAIIRYNQWKNAFIGNGGTALVAITYADGLQFYGNVLSNFDSSDGAVGFDGYSSSHNRVYNNTFIGGVGYNSGVAWGSGTDNLVYNNLFINCRTVGLQGTHDYNGFSDSNSRGEGHAQVNVPTSIFANYSGGNFKLVSDTSAGMTMASPFDKDLLGTTRGADGTVSRGAFEFVTGSVTALTPPSNLTVK